MFLRIKVYNDDSREVLVEDDAGNIVHEQVIGYMPIIYYVFATLVSCHIFGFTLMKVLTSIMENNFNVLYIFYFVCSLIIVSFILSPDVANKILPFELKRKDGLKKFIIIGIIMTVLFSLLLIN